MKINPDVYLRAADLLPRTRFSCSAIFRAAPTGHEHMAYKAALGPDDGDKYRAWQSGITIDQPAWMHEEENGAIVNLSTIKHERYCFLAMAYAMAKAGDLDEFS